MEHKDSIIAELREKVKALDKDIYYAATYGKQLVEEKTQLSSKIENISSQKELLEQEKHSLQLDLEAKVKALNSQTNELEIHRDRADSLQEKLQISEKENEASRKKIENIRKENQCLRKTQEDLHIENKLLKDKMSLLIKQIKNFEELAEKSMCEAEKDETQELQAQLSTYMLNNKELQDGLSQIQCEVEMAKKNENHLLEMVRELEETLSDRNSELSKHKVELKAAKEEIEELQGEIENLKFDQVDVKRRGNSVFAELDDRRHLVEREYKVLLKKYESIHENYDENKKELDRARGQMLILQSMASRDYQQTYINKLEDSLVNARIEISDLTHKLTKAIKSNRKLDVDKKVPEKSGYDYLAVMLKQSQKKEKDLQDEVLDLKAKSMCDSDKLNETQFLLFKAREDLDSTKREISSLKLKIKDFEKGIIQNIEPVVRKQPKIEIFEGFKPPTTSENRKKAKNFNISLFPVPDIIPGEIELFEDGFKQVKPSRKSNKFILRQFNRIDDESDGDCLKSSDKKSESVGATENAVLIAEEKELKPEEVVIQSKVSSKGKYDNCAQQ